ncbi:survival motor neuron protein (SMN) domain-containing protein [Purpureocillium lavendulum]|uniref:Survival motor neuron protein (SMN) domain-containing protein n=1 Tax=Purpureocillium lavendulum TaxID=1247861 RepID=A0AB34FPI9_9HYPO|nr:survival motor neuron protein (SMN) domain-containing protein [Purpureocillium lavendulum]
MDKSVWDDSALVDSWNEALEEYKKYHSIHAKGGSVKDLLAGDPSKSATTAAGRGGDVVDQKASAVAGESDDEGEVMSMSDENPENNETAGKADPALDDGTYQVPVAFPPQAVMGSIQDESLKRLMMAWYYAGYYTGLYEGQQQAQQAHQPTTQQEQEPVKVEHSQ